ncbi:SDR family oxidoreductase [Mycobacterium simiae]|uniref:SDR family oxidoreductase n=1 Tax=Mycobacterium simiae TaxID=1784 RepID=A0A5B1BKQ7_MYCSI|nr:NAD(P)H-binding protein [Mycobacterium simiae]KAA1249248.1 SDR family oxidoreductase [Mycobacterium simiae]
MSAGKVPADVPADAHCLVTGATGYIGARLIPRLLDEGHRVRALARDPSKLANVPWRERAELARGDLGDVDLLIAAFEGIDVVYYLVHSMGAATDFAAEEYRAARNVAIAARRTGVKRVVYLGGLHPENSKLSPHLQSRKAVGDALIASGIETVVLQAGVVVGSGSASFEMIRHLTDRLPVMTTPKWVRNRIQPIAIRDVLYYLVAAATVEVPSSRTWDIGGPDVLEYGDMMRIYAEVAGLHRRYLVVLPFLTPSIASLWVGTVTPIPSGLARPLIESLECDAVMRNTDIDTIVAPPPGGLSSYRAAVALALRRAAQGLPDATWDSLRSEPAEPLPSDPEWAGEIVYTDVRSAVTTAAPQDIWKAAEHAANGRRWYSFVLARRRRNLPQRWQVTERRSTTLRLSADTRLPGPAWLELTTDAKRYTQRAIFYPRGIPGRLYWLLLRPLYAAALRALAHDIASLG